MSLKNLIESKLLDQLQPQRLSLENESRHHNVPKGSETHWNAIIVSDRFAAQPLVQRHRMVYEALGEEIKAGIHALTMKTLTVEEWEAAGGEVTNPAPPCLGGTGK